MFKSYLRSHMSSLDFFKTILERKIDNFYEVHLV